MAYTNHTLAELYEKFGLKAQKIKLFNKIDPIEPSQHLQFHLEAAKKLPLGTEKARSEAIVMPILTDLMLANNGKFTVFSGYDLNVDKKQGLKGETDFLLAYSQDNITIEAPIFSVIEAKRQDIELGLPQCLAQLIAAQLFNQKKNKNFPLYGCVTTADSWQFVKLEDKLFSMNDELYFIDNLPKIMGTIQWVVDQV